jgi:hypothetical protein
MTVTLPQLRLRPFRRSTIAKVMGTSRTSLWRLDRAGELPSLDDWTGQDVVDLMQRRRANAGLPPHNEADILYALADTADAEDAANQKDAA